MKKNIRIMSFITLALLFCGAGTLLYAGTGDNEIIEPQTTGCYQSFGYCSDWGMNWKCITDYTAEICYKHACSDCPESGTIE